MKSQTQPIGVALVVAALFIVSANCACPNSGTFIFGGTFRGVSSGPAFGELSLGKDGKLDPIVKIHECPHCGFPGHFSFSSTMLNPTDLTMIPSRIIYEIDKRGHFVLIPEVYNAKIGECGSDREPCPLAAGTYFTGAREYTSGGKDIRSILLAWHVDHDGDVYPKVKVMCYQDS